jgi:putative acetyltransferase
MACRLWLTSTASAKSIALCGRSSILSWIKQPSDKLHSAKPEEWAGMAQIRLEGPGDAPEIRDLLEACFPGFGEADLVDTLRTDGDIVLSLAAEDENVVVGYLAFSRLMVEGANARTPAVALAPLAVYPEYQQQGIATRLVREGHACLAAMGEKLSVVVGEPHYYNRFGYHHRRAASFQCEYQSPYLMAISFGAAPSQGRLVYPAAFAALGSDDAALQAHDRV